MTLCDTGPLVALLNVRDADHDRCSATLGTLRRDELVTTWLCLTEAMYLLGRWGGIRAQNALWTYVGDGLVSLYAPAHDEWQRMQALMNDYADAPMDVADASLVVAGETLKLHRIFTLDRHFRAYRQRLGRRSRWYRDRREPGLQIVVATGKTVREKLRPRNVILDIGWTDDY
jgi:predicted nucleic acid-binding protein